MSRTTLAATALAVVLPLVAPAPSAASPGPVAAGHLRTASEPQAGPPVTIVASTRRAKVTTGYRVRIRGTVGPRAAGAKLVLQQRFVEQRRWRKVSTGRASTTGTFVLRDVPLGAAGESRYRVVMPAADGLRRAVSNEVPLTVWSTFPLTGFPMVQSVGVHAGVDVRVNTRDRWSSIVLAEPGTSGHVEYTLGRRCDWLRADYALTDESETGASGTVTVSVDGRPAVTHALGTGTLVEFHQVGVEDAFRVRIDLNGSATPPGRPAAVSPYVHCGP